MNSPTAPTPDDPRSEIADQLVSYLDGELDVREANQVEEALAADPQVRRELWQLERSWNMLDELPRTQVEESFTRSTVEMIAVRAEEELAVVRAQQPRRVRQAWLAGTAAVLVAAVVGYVIVAQQARQADEQLLRDLPLIENLDEYRDSESIEFLNMLKSSGFLQGESQHEQ